MITNLAIYGGTFCPIHWGHIRTARRAQQHMQFDQFSFLPCKAPVLDKAAEATAEQRVDMLRIALTSYPQFTLDLRELRRETPSFMVDTLRDVRNQYGAKLPITLVIGMDSFLQLPRWHQWQELLELAHLLVLTRAEVKKAPCQTLEKYSALHQTKHKHMLLEQAHGNIYFYNAGNYPISSTCIRNIIANGGATHGLLPVAIRQYIDQNHLFQSF
jgi:nicotinate-nucleotide adenylyltransferase